MVDQPAPAAAPTRPASPSGPARSPSARAGGEWSRTPVGASTEDEGLPLAEKVVIVFIRHRASGVKTKPRKYVIVVGEDESPLGWLDYSDAWTFEGQLLKQMIEAAGLAYEVERYGTEMEFERAHAEWVR